MKQGLVGIVQEIFEEEERLDTKIAVHTKQISAIVAHLQNPSNKPTELSR